MTFTSPVPETCAALAISGYTGAAGRGLAHVRRRHGRRHVHSRQGNYQNGFAALCCFVHGSIDSVFRRLRFCRALLIGRCVSCEDVGTHQANQEGRFTNAFAF